MANKSIKKRLDEILYEEILNNFLRGVYREGEEFNIAMIAESFGVSITPVTIAMKRMFYEKIIDRTPGGKYLMPVRTRESVEQLCDVRYTLEEKCILNLICSDTIDREKVLSDINGYANKSLESANEGDIVNSIKYDLDLHMTLVRSYENQYINQFYTQIRNKMMCWTYARDFTPSHQRSAVSEHFKIIEAISNRDVERTKALLFTHIDEICERLLH